MVITRIFIVAGYAPFRSNLALFIASLNAQYEVVGEATTDAEAMERIRRLRPDIVFVDINLPDSSGLATARTIRQERSNTAVIAITDRPSEEYRKAALAAGAAACVDKPALVGRLPGLMAALVEARTRPAGSDVPPDAPTESPLQP